MASRWGICLLLAAAGSVRAEGVMVGKFKEAPESAKIAIVAGEGELVAYVCSADQQFNEAYSRWFRGEVGDDGRFEIENEGMTLSGTVSKDKASGEISGKFAKAQSFTASLVADEGKAGLFRAQEFEGAGRCTAGWIVDEEGEVVGAVETTGSSSAKGIPTGKRKVTTAKGSKAPEGEVAGKTVKGERITGDVLKRAKKVAGVARLFLSPLPGDKIRGLIKAFDPDGRKVTLLIRGKEVEVDLGKYQITVRNGDDSDSEKSASKKEPLTKVGKKVRDRINKFFEDGNQVTLSFKNRKVDLDVSKVGEDDKGGN